LKNYWTGEYDGEAAALYDLAAELYEPGDSFDDLFGKVLDETPPYKYTSAWEQDEIKCIVSEAYDDLIL